ncbi:hypothetical protein BgiMline_007244 [Biomphalaria glabrata]|uniref:Uncharacterized protein n=1 Tax=Biomphalaria pfeifferi TaxID=112525 RepID=A0AAD8BDI7_BIOPF|nr:hypothetical protein BgiMline_022821 [Biomphalaria glabrata]KAI8787920.1 hypothetical protein BgiBS90_010588 [Biomphalaria glabrata]KAK0052297.1 hypothetical protein Bpfe_018380 [Biomphalaria pfeifferi]
MFFGDLKRQTSAKTRNSSASLVSVEHAVDAQAKSNSILLIPSKQRRTLHNYVATSLVHNALLTSTRKREIPIRRP